jgi:aspartyl-tRNA(Asn)/glutamyl-tRNA(Gln) amidotransferase subunit A
MTVPPDLPAIQAALRGGNLHCRQLVEHYLEQAERNRALNIYLEVFREEALAKASEIDARLAKGEEPGRLFGCVLSIKDVLCYAGHRVSAGSRMLEGFESQFSATAVERALAEDAIILGRVNCDEFAMGSTNEHSAFGPTRNPVDPERVPGGSSGASAAAVAAGTCLASLGSDTGGSVRQPAAFCGVFGLKPTYGRISRHGLIAYASSFDQIGILSRTATDAALLLQVIAGPDPYDSTVSPEPVPELEPLLRDDSPRRIAWLALGEGQGVDPAIAEAYSNLQGELEKRGHRLEPVQIPLLNYLVPAYYVMATAEASSNLARYDGLRYGHRTARAGDVGELYRKSRTEGFGAEVKRRIMLGTFVLSASYYDAYYRKAQQVRRLIKRELDRLWENCDLLLLPTTPSPAWPLGQMTDDPVGMYLADQFTVMANMAGLPAISIPFGYKDGKLPLGMQLLGPAFAEPALLALAHQLTGKSS